jgi:farnesyl diphosphate synthase
LSALARALEAAAAAVEEQLDSLIPMRGCAQRRLIEAMRYSALGGGKRLRPFLVLSSAALFDADRGGALRAAAAVELMHCYSLVHDDLPAMDDDELRRGRPTTHVRFDEATAILAGDGLLTLAFEVLADRATHSDAGVRSELVLVLARAAGMDGMVGGQMFDLEAEGRSLDLDQITELQALKTGALIACACDAGAILGRASAEHRAALGAFARDLGLAFQVADDLLDVEGEEGEVGKGVGKDAAAGKATFVSLLGTSGARAQANALADSAIAALDGFGARADRLREVARFVVTRRH